MLFGSSFSALVTFKQPFRRSPAQANIVEFSPLIKGNQQDQKVKSLENFISKEDTESFDKSQDQKTPKISSSNIFNNKDQFSITVGRANNPSDSEVGQEGKEDVRSKNKDPKKDDIIWQSFMHHTKYCLETAQKEALDAAKKAESEKVEKSSNPLKFKIGKSDNDWILQHQWLGNPPYF